MTDPALTRAEVSRTLRDLRVAKDMTVVDAAAAAGMSQSTLTRYEGGQHTPNDKAMRSLLGVYRPGPDTRRQLLASVREKQSTYRQVVMHEGATTAQRRILEAEESARRIVTFCPTVVPGMLQTEGYMRAIVGNQVPDVEKWVANRLKRHGLVTNPGKREILQIVTAGALSWALGSRDVMAGQLDHLAAVAEAGRITVGIIPVGTPAAVLPLHAWDLREDARGRAAVHFGTHGGVVTITDARAVAEYRTLLEQLRELAVYGGDAATEIRALRDRWYA